MLRPISTAIVFAAILAACSPTFNWREVRVQPAGMKALMPCKPESETRVVPMAGRDVDLVVLGCETGGATFALLFADLGNGGRANEVLGQWKKATLANLRGVAAREVPFRPPGALALPASQQAVVVGQRADGSKVESHAAYFAHRTHVFQAVIYSGTLKPEVAETFFSGISFE
ncbi:MAG: hypothetical protein ABIR26_08690 [Ramlibacter sp.]